MNALQSKRQTFLKEAGSHFENAYLHAEAGDVDNSAVYILKALDQERRAKSVGPQVLHLIKSSN